MDNHFMKLAVSQARKGMGRTSPNPVVGAVIVSDGQVVGQGYHEFAGGPHAEVNALHSAGGAAKDSTIYVTLEPCNHQGRTPPCTKAILESGIRRVVVGMSDPNPQVSGGGNDFLLNNGINLKCGVLVDECRALNRPFIKHVTLGLPWVILKAGVSLDGKIACRNGASGWITNPKSRNFGHKIRNKVDAILVGINTVIADNPSLTTRMTRGAGHDPLRVVIDTKLRMSSKAKMLQQTSKASTIIYCGPDSDPGKSKKLVEAGAIVQSISIGSDGQLDLDKILRDLGKRNINSLLVEGGGQVHGSFIRHKLADQLNLFIAPIFMGSDAVPVIDELLLDNVGNACRLYDVTTKRLDGDIMVEGFFRRP